MSLFGRGWKHTSRFFSKPFVSYNKENLKALEKILIKLKPGKFPNDLYKLEPNLFRYGQYNFTWLLAFNETEYYDFSGEWISTLQRFGTKSNNHLKTHRLSLAKRMSLFHSTDKEFWIDLQNIKKRNQKIAHAKAKGFFDKLYEKLVTVKKKADDRIHQNKFFGYYMTQYDNVNYVYEDCQKNGYTNETEKKIVVGGGLYKILKDAGSIVYKGIKIAGGDLSAVKGVVAKGASLLNKLGGLVAGLTDLVQGKEADFRRVTARFGLEQSVDTLKKKLLDKNQQGSLLDQTISGPQKLERSAGITFEELEELREALRHSIWWCDNWKLDIKEIKKDLNRPDHIDEMQRQLKFDTEKAIIKPSQIAKLRAFVKRDKTKLKKDIAILEGKVKKFDYLLQPRLKKVNELLSAYDTRKSISKTQKKLASVGVEFDKPRQLANEIKGFDKTKLRSASKRKLGPKVKEKIGTESTKAKKKSSKLEDQELSIQELVKKALAERRTAIAYDDDEDDDDESYLDF